MRPGNALLSGIGVLVGALALEGAALLSRTDAWWAALSGIAGTVGGNVLNDLADQDLDRHAHPHRALVTGAVTPRTAAALLVVAWLVALGAAALVSTALLFVAAVLIGVLVAYEVALKAAGLPGNVAVALVAGALFPFGALAVAGGANGTGAEAVARALGLPVVLGAIAALAHLGRELQKDAEDAAADAALRRTFAVRHGPRTAALVGAVALIMAVVLAPLPHLRFGWGNAYLVALVPGVVLFLASAWSGVRHPARGRALAKTAMVLALAAFVVGAVLP